MEKDQPTAIVTGTSTGIGFETSLLLARNGFYTFATMRDTSKSTKIEKIANDENLPLEVLTLNVDDSDSVKETIQKILTKRKQIDILVNNAGYGLFGALEDISMEQIKQQFETNLFGAIRMIKETLPIMRKQKNGIMINVSSIAGIIGPPTSSAYASTKFALEGLCESISYELEPYRIKVILIEPGVINTNFVPNIRLPTLIKDKLPQQSSPEEKELVNEISDDYSKKKNHSHYSSTVNAFLSHYYPAMMSAPLPQEVSAVILESIKNAKNSPECFFRHIVGKDAKAFFQAKKTMTDSLLHKFISDKLLS
jgi:NAD(P)-dependent dehydrogenase (short-subunit alcohol dehydrogenase family)